MQMLLFFLFAAAEALCTCVNGPLRRDPNATNAVGESMNGIFGWLCKGRRSAPVPGGLSKALVVIRRRRFCVFNTLWEGIFGSRLPPERRLAFALLQRGQE
jgi:hypothetical protein